LSRAPVVTWAASVVLGELSAGFSHRSVLYRVGGLPVTCGAVPWILAKNFVRPGVVAPNFSGRRLVNSTVATSTVTPRRESFEQRMDCTSPRGAAPPRRACRQRSSTGAAPRGRSGGNRSSTRRSPAPVIPRKRMVSRWECAARGPRVKSAAARWVPRFSAAPSCLALPRQPTGTRRRPSGRDRRRLGADDARACS
jgi:hypothetical protein